MSIYRRLCILLLTVMMSFIVIDIDSMPVSAIDIGTLEYKVEVGGMGIKDGRIYYAPNAKKIRSKDGILYRLSAGNKISLNDYSSASLLIYITQNGADYSTKKLTKGCFTASEDCFFAFTINFTSIQYNINMISLLNYTPENINGKNFVSINSLIEGLEKSEDETTAYDFSVEIGGMGIRDGSIYYASNRKKIRSKNGVLYKIQSGDSIGLNDYSEASLLLYLTPDGKNYFAKKLTSGYYKANSDIYVAFSINSQTIQTNTDLIRLLSFVSRSIENNKYEISIEELRSLHLWIRPSFAIIDDDGHETVYNYLYPWALSQNVPFTDALPTKIISNSKGTNFLTVAQVKEMYYSGMVTFGSHTVNHTPNLSKCENPIYELSESKKTIESWGIPCKYIIYPNGVVTDEQLTYMDDYYDYGFLAGGAQRNGIHIQNRVNYYPINKYQIMRTALNGQMSDKELNLIKQQINECIDENGLMVFMIHIGQSATVEEDLNVYSVIVEYIRNKGYDIESLDVVMDRFQ